MMHILKNHMKICIFFSILFLMIVPISSAEDLIMDNQVMVLSGNFTYDDVSLTNGSIIYIEAYNGTSGTGELHLFVDNILIDETSSINGDGNGSRNAEGIGAGTYGGVAGAGGGGYGGSGGAGGGYPYPAGGIAFGTSDGEDISMGSGGGVSQSSYGGRGGALLDINATNSVEIYGTITLDGTNGQSESLSAGCGGGGAGGGLLIHASTVNLTGSTISADGGNGGDSSYSPDDDAGGAGGGRIKFFNETPVILTDATLTVDYGTGTYAFGSGSQNGVVGTINYEFWAPFDESATSDTIEYTITVSDSQNTVLSSNNTLFGTVLAGSTNEILNSFNLTNSGNSAASVNITFTTNVGNIYGLTNNTYTIGGANFSMGLIGQSYIPLNNLDTDTPFSVEYNIAADAIPDVWKVQLTIPSGQPEATYTGIIEITFSNA